ncbi:MAG: hypothetical protein ACON5K_10690 [Bacteroidia bacterium]
MKLGKIISRENLFLFMSMVSSYVWLLLLNWFKSDFNWDYFIEQFVLTTYLVLTITYFTDQIPNLNSKDKTRVLQHSVGILILIVFFVLILSQIRGYYVYVFPVLALIGLNDNLALIFKNRTTNYLQQIVLNSGFIFVLIFDLEIIVMLGFMMVLGLTLFFYLMRQHEISERVYKPTLIFNKKFLITKVLVVGWAFKDIAMLNYSDQENYIKSIYFITRTFTGLATLVLLSNINREIILQLKTQQISFAFSYYRLLLVGVLLGFLSVFAPLYFDELSLTQIYFELLLSLVFAFSSVISKLLTVHGEYNVMNLYSFCAAIAILVVSLILPYYFASIPLLFIQAYVVIYYSKLKGIRWC